MGTPALIRLDNPRRGPAEFVRVHYDGAEHTRDSISELITRDGYGTVRQHLLSQPSRFWVGLDPQLEGMPDYTADYPRDWRVQAVPGYGLVFIGEAEVAASNDALAFDPDSWEGCQWHITPGGRVAG